MVQLYLIPRSVRILAVGIFLLATASIFASQGYSSVRGLQNSERIRPVKFKLVRTLNNALKITKITEFPGKMATLVFTDGREYGLVPEVHDGGNVSVALHKIAMDGETVRMDEELETIALGKRELAFPMTQDFPFGIVLDSTEQSSDEETHTSRSAVTSGTTYGSLRPIAYRLIPSGLAGLQGADRCCVTCDGVTTCACAVEADCGSCCAPKCCYGLLGG